MLAKTQRNLVAKFVEIQIVLDTVGINFRILSHSRCAVFKATVIDVWNILVITCYI